MILRSYLKMPVSLIPLPTMTDKWDIAEIAYYIACDNAMSGIKTIAHLDYCVNTIYNWVDALVETEDIHIIDIIAEKIFMVLVNIYKNYDFMAAINSPYELTECSARVNRGERYVTFFFEYEDGNVHRNA